MDVSKLKELYENKSDKDLFDVLESKEDYTEGTINIVEGIVNNRGGYENLKKNVELQINRQNEIEELNRAAKFLLSKGKDIDQIKQKINCNYLEESEVVNLLQEILVDYNKEEIDKKVSFKSLFRGILGGVVGGVLGGFLWGLMIIKSGRIFYIFAFGLFLLSYFFVWLFSKKSLDNKGTVVITILSVVMALFIGQLLFEIYGLEEYIK